MMVTMATVVIRMTVGVQSKGQAHIVFPWSQSVGVHCREHLNAVVQTTTVNRAVTDSFVLHMSFININK
jgi:hypothetical protein